jgi:hypothetical protein
MGAVDLAFRDLGSVYSESFSARHCPNGRPDCLCAGVALDEHADY